MSRVFFNPLNNTQTSELFINISIDIYINKWTYNVIIGGENMNTYLFKRQVSKQGYESYYDLFLCWERDGKVYHVEIKPSFNNGYRVLMARAVEVLSGEPFEKYM